MSRPWRTVVDIRAAVQRRWADGTLLRAYARGEEFPRIAVPLRSPTTSQLAEQWEDARTWMSSLKADSREGQRFTLEEKSVGGRTIGRNRVPSTAVISTYDQAWSLLGKSADIRTFDRLLDASSQDEAAHRWAIQRPLAALELSPRWTQLLSAYRWLAQARGTGKHLRQIDAEGVDTKFIEQTRKALADMLDVPAAKGDFESGLGLATKPAFIRLRLHRTVTPVEGLEDLSVRVEEFGALKADLKTVLLVENEITFLTVPIPADGAVVWGKGFQGHRSRALEQLSDSTVYYWGDLDTYGFAILNGVRSILPQARSVLMDRDTLLHHRGQWGVEPQPTATPLQHLFPTEAALYDDLVTGVYAQRIRLEQERINWAWALERLAAHGVH